MCLHHLSLSTRLHLMVSGSIRIRCCWGTEQYPNQGATSTPVKGTGSSNGEYLSAISGSTASPKAVSYAAGSIVKAVG